MLIIRLLALFAVLWTGKQVVKQVSSRLHPEERAKSGSATSPQHVDDDMVKDPVCSTYIPKSLAHSHEFDGQTHYFCSDECLAKFMEQHAAASDA